MPRRSILLHGLRLVLRSPGALLWTYGFNLLFAFLASLSLRARLNDVLAHSLAAQRLTSAFDVGVLSAAMLRLNRDAPSSGSAPLLIPALYLLVFFLLTPGALVSYRTGTSSRLTALVGNGFRFAGRFLLIVAVSALVSGVVLGVLLALYSAWGAHVDQTTVGNAALWLTWPLLLVILVVASILRLYFDLVEVYTVALAEQTTRSGAQDRRIWRVLLPAARTLGRNFFRATGVFLLLSLVGLSILALTGSIAVRTLAESRTWPLFLLTQLGLFTLLLTRFWQRGAETVLAEEFPLILDKARSADHPYLRPERTPLPPVPDFGAAALPVAPPPPPLPSES